MTSVMDKWQTEAVPMLERLQPVMQRFNAASIAGNMTASIAGCDELAAVAVDVKAWYLGHPCPNAEGGVHFVGVARAFADMAAAVHDAIRVRSLAAAVDDELRVRSSGKRVSALIALHWEEARFHSRRLRDICG